jgi:hypothetical protein
MSSFDYSAPAELFLSKPAKGSRTKYRRFATAAEALRYAVEDLRIPKAFGAWLEVGDERFSSSEIQRLYEADDYPLPKSEWPNARPRVRSGIDGAPFASRFQVIDPTTDFKEAPERATAPYDQSERCERIGQLGAYLFLSHSSSEKSGTSRSAVSGGLKSQRPTVQCCAADHSFLVGQV